MRSRISLLFILLALWCPSYAQSDYLSPAENFQVEDIITDKLFASFEVNDGKAYGFDTDGIHAYDLSSGSELFTEAKPADYAAQPGFMKVDQAGEYLWMGFTKSDYSDDRIYRFNLSEKTWEHMATLPANFDLEFIGSHILISGLNSNTWGDPNSIWLLDLSGANDHTKIVETGGSSAGIATDESGQLFYATYFMSEDNHVYRWEASAVQNTIDGNNSALSLSDATLLADLPAGAYDCDTDEVGNLIFNCNDYTNGGFVAIWNGTTGSGENYIPSCTTSEWLTFVKATGNANAGDAFFTMAYAQAIAKIQGDISYNIELTNPISDKRLAKNTTAYTIDLNTVFQFEGGDLAFEISSNTNNTLINATIEEAILSITAEADQLGSATLEITASFEDQSLSDAFEITLFDYNYDDGVFILNEDWFGHDEGSLNFFTNEGDFVYRAYRNENPGETLGTTSQFATSFGNHLIFMSKQGNRLVVSNRQTLEKEAVFQEIGGDGRSFVGINEEKAYVGTSNGIRILHLDDLSLGNFIPGFSGETGGMLAAENYVFVITGNQVKVLEDDVIIETYGGATFAGITRSIDGNVWVGAGSQLMKISPYTLEEEMINLPNDMSISGSNGAWNAGSLCASNTENALFWSEAGSWGSSNMIYKYSIGDLSSLDEVFVTLPDDWVLYGAGLRVHPVDNEIYATAKKDGWGDNSKFNTLFVIDGETANIAASVALEEYFWFPALPLMVDKYAPELSNEIIIDEEMNHGDLQIDLYEYISDMDNLQAGIEFEILDISNSGIISAEIADHMLHISFLADASGDVILELKALSNGKAIVFDANIHVRNTLGLAQNTLAKISCSPNPFNNSLLLEIPSQQEYHVSLYNLKGQLVFENKIISSTRIALQYLPQGTYLLKLVSDSETFTQKVIKN